MAELNIVEKANKVITFRKYIREECRKKNIEYPSDEKIAEYITKGYGMDVEEFMKAYEGKVGIFKDLFDDFKKEVLKHGFATTPTDEEMRSYVTGNGYNVKGFLREHIINSFDPLQKATLLATLALKDDKLVRLWNIFIEESAMYGEDSYIYDLKNEKDLLFIDKNLPHNKKAELTRIIRNAELHNEKVRYIQWYSLNNNEISVKNDIDGIIVAYWDDIFPRIMLYPYAYQFEVEKYCEGDASTYFDDVFFPILAEKLGYKIDGDKGTITKIA